MEKLNQTKYKATLQIRRYDDIDEQELIDYYQKFTTLELITDIEDTELSKLQRDIARAYLCDKLELVPKEELEYYDEWFLHEELIPYIQKLVNEFNELKSQFLNHRHALDKTYGEKPIW